MQEAVTSLLRYLVYKKKKTKCFFNKVKSKN